MSSLEAMANRDCSRVGTEPVAGGLVRLEHLLTELLVAARLHSVQLETVRVGVHVMVLREQVGDWVEGCDHTEHHHEDDSLIGLLVLAEVGNVLGDVVGHLWGR